MLPHDKKPNVLIDPIKVTVQQDTQGSARSRRSSIVQPTSGYDLDMRASPDYKLQSKSLSRLPGQKKADDVPQPEASMEFDQAQSPRETRFKQPMNEDLQLSSILQSVELGN